MERARKPRISVRSTGLKTCFMTPSTGATRVSLDYHRLPSRRHRRGQSGAWRRPSSATRACRGPASPCATASSTFALPSLKYIRRGTSVSPFSSALPANLSISRRCSSSFRGRFGLWFSRLPIRVFGDLRPDQPHLAVVDAGVGVFEVRVPVAQALHLGADEHDPALDPCRGSRSRAVARRFRQMLTVSSAGVLLVFLAPFAMMHSR